MSSRSSGMAAAAGSIGNWLIGSSQSCVRPDLERAENLARETKDTISAQRFGSNPESMSLREKDAQNRLDMLARAREVDPKATAKHLFHEEHAWLLSR